MHELSVACAVVRTVSEAVTGRRVTSVRLRVGVLSGVAPQALTFAWDVAVAGSPLAGAALVVDRVPVSVGCRTCGAVSALPEPLPVRCPGCEGRDVAVVAGSELEVASVEVTDDAEGHAGDVAAAGTAAATGTRVAS